MLNIRKTRLKPLAVGVLEIRVKSTLVFVAWLGARPVKVQLWLVFTHNDAIRI